MIDENFYHKACTWTIIQHMREHTLLISAQKIHSKYNNEARNTCTWWKSQCVRSAATYPHPMQKVVYRLYEFKHIARCGFSHQHLVSGVCHSRCAWRSKFHTIIMPSNTLNYLASNWGPQIQFSEVTQSKYASHHMGPTCARIQLAHFSTWACPGHQTSIPMTGIVS